VIEHLQFTKQQLEVCDAVLNKLVDKCNKVIEDITATGLNKDELVNDPINPILEKAGLY
jgi:hypothetical protein